MKSEQRVIVLACLWMTLANASPEHVGMNATLLKRIANVSYGDTTKPSMQTSLFSPRMDFDQWKPLTGRGDPLRNDPTYDYEPPVLERVHYWAEETRLERERYPERKSEVLMLGISSRKPSVTPHQSSVPPRRHHHPQLSKYEDFSYKVSEHYPMTILVPPPPPQSGLQFSYYDTSVAKIPLPMPSIKPTESTTIFSLKTTSTTSAPEFLTTLYSLQEANLIYQASTTSQGWISNLNESKLEPNSAVSSEYAGWGPTTPLDEIDSSNDTYNFVLHDYKELQQHPYSFYKPIPTGVLPSTTPLPLVATFLPTFVPTPLPSTSVPPLPQSTSSVTKQDTYQAAESIISEVPAATIDQYQEPPNEPQEIPSDPGILNTQRPEVLEMLRPMMSMPIGNGPERPEDNQYHSTKSSHIFKSQDDIKIENMQTMQPPPVVPVQSTSTTLGDYSVDPNVVNDLLHRSPSANGLDPYLNMRFTTPAPKLTDEDTKSTTEPAVPMYLIIQGHSKVKTYGSKHVENNVDDTTNNEIPKSNGIELVKHLHPIKEKNKRSDNANTKRQTGAKTLKTLVDSGIGSIEIQETDIGIKYDVSDGSDVPVEVYRKGIVDSAENAYQIQRMTQKKQRLTRQVEYLEDLFPFDEDTIDKYIYDFLNGKRNETGVTGLIAKAVTSDVASELDDIDEEGSYSEQSDEDR